MSPHSGERRLTSSKGEFTLESRKLEQLRTLLSQPREEARRLGCPTIKSLSLFHETLDPGCLSEAHRLSHASSGCVSITDQPTTALQAPESSCFLPLSASLIHLSPSSQQEGVNPPLPWRGPLD